MVSGTISGAYQSNGKNKRKGVCSCTGVTSSEKGNACEPPACVRICTHPSSTASSRFVSLLAERARLPITKANFFFPSFRFIGSVFRSSRNCETGSSKSVTRVNQRCKINSRKLRANCGSRAKYCSMRRDGMIILYIELP